MCALVGQNEQQRKRNNIINMMERRALFCVPYIERGVDACACILAVSAAAGSARVRSRMYAMCMICARVRRSTRKPSKRIRMPKDVRKYYQIDEDEQLAFSFSSHSHLRAAHKKETK